MTWRRRLSDVAIVMMAMVIDLVMAGTGPYRVAGSGSGLPYWVVPAATVGAFICLFWRRRWPVGVFAVEWVYGLAGLIVVPYVTFAGILVALHAVATRSRVPVAWAVLRRVRSRSL